ncbi:peptidoglycan-binding domain-containing protein [Kribbella deserti]|uniref:Peptidoglycan-binding protein n=1 Tax=Kribbella deserti TaxID=1926257 RepID=A0ABV6QW06_9ACTN
MGITRKAGATALALAALGTALTVATPANAATPTAATPNCTKLKSTNLGNGWFLNTPGYDAPKGSSSFNCYLELGDRNGAVLWLQKTIAYCYDDGDIVEDGIYGPLTRDKVKAVQRHGGAPQTGIYGPITRKSMQWRLYNVNTKRYSELCYKVR